LIYLFDNIIFWLICSGVRVYNIVFFGWFDFGSRISKKKKKKKDFLSRRWAWVAVGLVAGMGYWSGSVAVGQWLLAEVGGFGLLGLVEVGGFGLLGLAEVGGGCWLK
jgi:hypothetical protein